ncbi:MAG TPA: ATP-binding protein [Candidatus Polarisedimenticolaceae bacterium]|nr:ATP-binding protein [Candidatus Polarisedimenticolaceae bacterium]
MITAVLLGFWSSLEASESPDPYAATQANLAVTSVRLTDNGDNDGFADPNETVNIFVTLRNRSGSDRNGVVVRMATNDPKVGCIPTPIISFGSLLAGEIRESTAPLVLRLADAARLDPFQDLSVTLDFVVSGNDFNTTLRSQSLTLDLDLNVSGGFLPSTYSEGFENAGFGSFTTQTLDLGRESLTASNGFRWQYNDPDFINSNSYGRTFCYLGAPTAAQNAYDWHVHTLTAPDGGRAYLGDNSLHWGVHAGSAGMDTTRLRQLDAIRTTLPINLGWNAVRSELLPRLFEPFLTTKPSGLGIGLAISKVIVEAHGGVLSAENNTRGGATFRFTLRTATAGSKQRVSRADVDQPRAREPGRAP